MRTSCEGFTCVECVSKMEQVDGVPVLQSLQGLLIYRCGECGHILLVLDGRAEDWSAGWLAPLFMELEPGITCMAMV